MDWLHDDALSFDAQGFLVRLLTYVPPGVVASEADLNASRYPDDRSLRDLVAELKNAGYLRLVPGGEEHYRLVHPDRLAPLAAE